MQGLCDKYNDNQDLPFYEFKGLKEIIQVRKAQRNLFVFENGILQVPSNKNAIFEGCFNIEFVEVFKNQQEKQYNECDKIKTIMFHSHVSVLGKYGFTYAAIKILRLPEYVTVIPERCFFECKNLITVRGIGVTQLDPYCFGYCISLQDIYAPKLKIIKEFALYMCNELQLIPPKCLEVVERGNCGITWIHQNTKIYYPYVDVEKIKQNGDTGKYNPALGEVFDDNTHFRKLIIHMRLFQMSITIPGGNLFNVPINTLKISDFQ